MIKPEDLLVVISRDIKNDLLRGTTLVPSYVEVEYTAQPYIVIKEIEETYNAFVKELKLFPSIIIYVIRIRDEHSNEHEYYYIVNRATKTSYLVRSKDLFYDFLITEYNNPPDVVNIFSLLLDSWIEEHCEKINL